MGHLTDYSEDKILDHILMNDAFNRPANLFLALCDADPGETATGGSISEPSGGAYARQACDDWTVAAARASASSVAIAFPMATGRWGVETHFAILDTLTLATGNVIAYGPISPAKTITTGDTFSIDAGDMDVSFDAGGFSDYTANAMLNHLFADTPFAQPTSLFIALSTATILDNDTGTTISEPGENYARILHTNFAIAAAGASANSGAVTFAKATGGDWSTVTDIAICNTLTTGNQLMHAPLTIEKDIDESDVAVFNDGEIDLTID